jgi:hypothetical protein
MERCARGSARNKHRLISLWVKVEGTAQRLLLVPMPSRFPGTRKSRDSNSIVWVTDTESAKLLIYLWPRLQGTVYDDTQLHAALYTTRLLRSAWWLGR